MAEEDDLKLPEEKNAEVDSKNLFEEQREMSESEKEKFEKQKRFEYKSVEGEELRKGEEKKETLRQRIFKFIVGGVIFILLIALYFWLLA
ncbi:hypothetical protein J4411_02740 [Candidatus Pacearchaeota archaeon]|nr:hypothetical protein [Candidatus Pacearchaeota archaeon]